MFGSVFGFLLILYVKFDCLMFIDFSPLYFSINYRFIDFVRILFYQDMASNIDSIKPIIDNLDQAIVENDQQLIVEIFGQLHKIIFNANREEITENMSPELLELLLKAAK